jgi:putative membrane protein
MPTNARFGLAFSLLAAQAFVSSAFAQEPQTPATASAAQHSAAALMNVSPQSFATQAAVMGNAEIEFAQLALDKSKNAGVRAYAQRMVKDHTATNANLKKLATQQNITLPNTLDSTHQAVKQKLAGLDGEDFDRQYRQEMAKGHDKAVVLFQSATQSAQMPEEFKEFAAAALSSLEDHHERAQQLGD